MARWRAWSHALDARLRLRLAEAHTRFPVIARLISRMHAVNILDAATRLAAQSFLTAIPLFFLIASFAPSSVRNQLVSSLRTVFGLTGAVNAQLDQLLQSHTGGVRDTIGVVGALMVLISATAVSRALQRLCRRAFAVPKAASKVAPWRWLVWIAVWMLALLVQGPLRNGFGAGLWLGIPVTAISLTLLLVVDSAPAAGRSGPLAAAAARRDSHGGGVDGPVGQRPDLHAAGAQPQHGGVRIARGRCSPCSRG